MKQILTIKRDADRHWVGDGFPVQTLFSYQEPEVNPFLLFDYAGPHEFEPSSERRGVGEHPHRGFETVTIVYRGELEHRDSAGHHGRIGPGDVQWMTAASGVVHEEYHSEAFAKRGGTFEVVQLWVNLPKKDKTAPPKYQSILSDRIPVVEIGGGGVARVIAGELRGVKGPAETFTPINVWDLKLKAGGASDVEMPEGHTTLLVALQGSVKVNGPQRVDGGEVAVFDRSGTRIELAGEADATALVLTGEPIGEPVAGWGPFVMNNQAELKQAAVDYQSGRMGRL
jgi:hypothetical protein